MEPARVTVRLSAQDYGAFIGFVMRSSLLKLQLMLGGGALAWLFVCVFSKQPPSSSPRVWPEDLATAAMIVVVALFLPKAWNAFFGWSTARKRAHRGSTDYEIREEGLYFRNNAEEGVRAWSAFQKVARKGSASYLLVTPIVGFIFPDHCFATKEDSARFFDQLLEHLKAAGQPVNWQASKPSQAEPLDPATVTVQLEPKDIRRFASFLPGGKWRQFVIWGFVVILVVALLGSGYSNATHIVPTRPGAVLGNFLLAFFFANLPIVIFLTFLGFFLWRRQRSNYQKLMPDVFKSRTYTVSDEGLFCKSETGEMITDWRAVVRFVETDAYLYVMIAKRNGIVVPKRCFATREAAAIFANQVRLHLEKHAPAALATV